MDLRKIKALLEKYYNGDTTLDEEKILREYFTGDQISDELMAEKDIFLYHANEMADLDSIPDFSDDIWSNLQKQKNTNKLNISNIAFVMLKVAAGIIIIISFFVLMKDQHFSIQKDIKYTDTYDNPEQAYLEAKETLLYVSAMLNSGTNHLEPIKKLNEGTKELNNLKSFNDGLKELDPINKYNLASKYLK